MPIDALRFYTTRLLQSLAYSSNPAVLGDGAEARWVETQSPSPFRMGGAQHLPFMHPILEPFLTLRFDRLPVVFIATAATGLNPVVDRILQIAVCGPDQDPDGTAGETAALIQDDAQDEGFGSYTEGAGLRGESPDQAGREKPTVNFDYLFNPGSPIPCDATKIHGIDDSMVEREPRLSDRIDTVLAHLDGKILVGRHVAIDLAILNFEAKRCNRRLPQMAYLDVLDVARVVLNLPKCPSLEDLTRVQELGFCLNHPPCHNAAVDILITRDVYDRLGRWLQRDGITTLAEWNQHLHARKSPF